jgi:ATP-binding cassette, subfamily B (MDR/TAP), member 1
MRAALLRAILRQEVGWFDTNNGGELATVLSEAAVAFQEGTGRRIADGAQAFAQFAAGLVIAFTQSWRLSLVLIAGLPLIGGAAAMLGQTMAETKSASGEQYAKAGGVANEALGSIRTVASLCAERRFIEGYGKFLEEAKRVGIQKSAKLGLANGVLFSAAFFVYALAFYYGSQLVAENLDCVTSGGSNCITGTMSG